MPRGTFIKQGNDISMSHIYSPQRSCGKVMFSQASVILFTRRGVSDRHSPGRHPPWANTPLGRPTPLGRHPPWADTPPQQTATAADGTHPTGMHSCFIMWLQRSERSHRNHIKTIFRCLSVSCQTVEWNLWPI